MKESHLLHKKDSGAEGMAPPLRSLVVLPEDTSLVPSIHDGWFTITHKFSFRAI